MGVTSESQNAVSELLLIMNSIFIAFLLRNAVAKSRALGDLIDHFRSDSVLEKTAPENQRPPTLGVLNLLMNQ